MNLSQALLEGIANDGEVVSLPLDFVREYFSDHAATKEKPQRFRRVMILLSSGRTVIGSWNGNEWLNDNGDKTIHGVTHWRPFSWGVSHANEK